MRVPNHMIKGGGGADYCKHKTTVNILMAYVVKFVFITRSKLLYENPNNSEIVNFILTKQLKSNNAQIVLRKNLFQLV